jgi:hypothetical protein
MSIQAAHYFEALEALKSDPIIIGMVPGLLTVPLSEISHENGGPRFEFMSASVDEYRRRGGQHQEHLGAIAEALLALIKDRNKS